MIFKDKKTYTVFTGGAPVLAQKAREITEIDDEVKTLAADMLQAMYLFNGIGLAAPQYGVSRQLVVIDVPADDDEANLSPGERLLCPLMPLALVNPSIVAASGETSDADEGCLSVPDIYAPVVRPASVVVKFTTLGGENVEIECGNLLGRCMQHEIDHLHGILFTDRLAPAAAKKIAGELADLKKRGKKNGFCRIKKK